MAAFLGNHAVLALIKNYVPLEAVTYYTKPMGLEKEAKLSSEVANPLYDLIMQVNLHPVRIAMYLERSEVIRKHISSAYKVLDLMCEKESKRAEGVNEVRQYLMGCVQRTRVSESVCHNSLNKYKCGVGARRKQQHLSSRWIFEKFQKTKKGKYSQKPNITRGSLSFPARESLHGEDTPHCGTLAPPKTLT
ncbi:ankyrin repeat and MYND domain-containing protein 2-like [Penaeus monodon]|uniref:ankyrin repeat and MYND domain-containing protein 2-like n=1 Tax=Penaeus monodon TaxID=6687 RepID=UPI0018A7347A|nr:ankyrin repeat and MYND domain-containing protein 2-like [Penaeus monodon]